MKKLILGCMACVTAGLLGCSNGGITEYSIGDTLSFRVQRVQGEDERSLYSVVARVRENCREREAKVAFAFEAGALLGLTLKGTSPHRVSCAI